MPRTSNTLFTGRDAILDSMNKALLAPRTTSSETLRRVFVLLGIGGSGKSEVAVKFAEMHRESFWGVFWVDADTPQSAESGFEKIAEACKPPDSSIDGVRDWLANTRKSWLLILDNCDDPQGDYNRYFPPAQRGTVIMTTRVSECKKYGSCERMDEMEHQDGVKLLLKACHVPEAQWEQKQASAQSVTSLLGFHALALVHAGSYINSGHCTLSQYPKVYEAQQRRLLEYKPGQMQSRYDSVYATFEVSASALKAASSQDDTSALALQLLEVLASMHRDNVQEEFFKRASEWIHLCEEPLESHMENEVYCLSTWHTRWATCTGLFESSLSSFREARAKLAELSLVTLSAENNISLHPLVHEWAQIRMEPNETGEAWTKAACIFALSIKNDWGWNELTTALQPHLEICYKLWPAHESQNEIPLDLGRIFYAFYWQLYQANSSEALPLAQMLSCRLRPDPESETARYRYIDFLVSSSLCINDQLQEAADLLEKIVDARKTLEASDAVRLSAQHELASLYSRLGEHQKAIPLLEEIIRIRETTLEPGDSSLLGSQHALAHSYSDTGEYQKAITLLEVVVRIQETTLKPEHPDRLNSQHELAIAYSRTGEYQKAITLLEEVVRIRETTLKPEHSDRLASQHNLAVYYADVCQYEKAKEILENVVEIRQRILNPDHPHRILSEECLAIVNERLNETKADPAPADRVQSPSRPPPIQEMGTSAATSTTELPIRS